MEHLPNAPRRTFVPADPSNPSRQPARRRWLRGAVVGALAIGIAVPAAAAGLGQTEPPATAASPAAGTRAPTDQALPTDGAGTAESLRRPGGGGALQADAAVAFGPGGPMLTGAPIGNRHCNNTERDAPDPAATGGRYGRAKLAGEQVQTAAAIVSVGKAMKVKRRGIRIALLVAMQESALDPFAKHGRFVGLFQQPKAGFQKYDRADAIGASRMFYSALRDSAPRYAKDSRPDWAIAEKVQHKHISLRYNGWRTTAKALVRRLYPKVGKYDFPPKPDTCPEDGEARNGVPDTFDPGLIISDDVFYDADAMSLQQIRAFIAGEGADCSDPWCLKNLRLHVATEPADEYCLKIPGGTDDAAELIWKVSLACQVNPQVMLVTLQKESGLLTETDVEAEDYTAAWGWHCPDTGPGGTAACDPQYSGFIRQAKGMAKQWARYVVHPQKYHFQAGETTEILYNVEQSGCGGSEVTIRNQATASLYNYTPYQPNAASLASYPGTGDACSSYGNRNFYFLYSHYFGTVADSTIDVKGVDVTIPQSPYVPQGLAGKTVQAPTADMAKGLAAGLAALGTPYVWGGGTNDGGPDEGCSRGGGASNSCQGIVGFDCSGLTGYVLQQAGFHIGTNSSAQRSSGQDVAWPDALPGDIIGYDGHVTIYLGIFDGVPYMLEAPGVGKHVRIRNVHDGADPVVHRYWS